MEEKSFDTVKLGVLAGLVHGVVYMRKQKGLHVDYPTMLAAMLTAAVVGVLVSLGLDYLDLDRRLIMIAVAVSGYLGGTLLETVADGVMAAVRRYLRLDRKE